MKVPWWQVNMGESPVELVKEVAQVKSYSMGEYCQKFEVEIAKKLNSSWAMGVTSGSDALLISLLALGVKAGDKVLVQDRSWIAAANAIAILGATPVFVDVESDSPTISLTDLKIKHSRQIRVLIVVHMNGRHGDFQEVLNFCEQNGIEIVEDAAQALGSNINGRYLGTFGTVGCFSLSIAKIVGSGQGGFCTTNHADLQSRLFAMRTHGTYDTFSASWDHIGFNFRLTDFHAAIASTQLLKLESRIEKAKTTQEIYAENLKELIGVKLIPVNYEIGEVGPYIEILVNERRVELIAFLETFEIDVRPFYPAVSSAVYLKGEGATPNARRFARMGMYLPSGPDITREQIEFVTEKINAFYKK